MRVSAENETDRDFRIIRKSDGQEVPLVAEADTDAGEYTRYATGENGFPLDNMPCREIHWEDGRVERYMRDGNGGERLAADDEPEFLMETVREPFRIIHARTREVVAETTE
jgi:hypothetical protein